MLSHLNSWRASVFSPDPPEISSAVRLLWDISIQGNTTALARSARAAALAALRVSLVSLSLSAPTSSRVPPRGRRGGRAAVSAAASSEPRLAPRLLEPRLVCRRVGGVVPPRRVSLVSLFVYSSLASCAASWAAWRAGGCRCCLPAQVSLASHFVYSSLSSLSRTLASACHARAPPSRVRASAL